MLAATPGSGSNSPVTRCRTRNGLDMYVFAKKERRSRRCRKPGPRGPQMPTALWTDWKESTTLALYVSTFERHQEALPKGEVAEG